MKTVGGLRRARFRGLDRTALAGYLVGTAYNLVRLLMLEAARQHEVPPTRLSFKGTISTLRAVAHLFATPAREAARRYEDLLAALACDPVPLRPDRSEPRAVKRRPKVYQLLTKPRRAMRVSKSRRQQLTTHPLN